MNVLNNDKFILNQIINTLSGCGVPAAKYNNKNSIYLNEIFKIEKTANEKLRLKFQYKLNQESFLLFSVALWIKYI